MPVRIEKNVAADLGRLVVLVLGMPTITGRDGEVRVFTFKEGLLSAVAHDLELGVDRFEVTWDDAATTLRATFDPKSLRVLHPVVHGQPSPASLSARDLRKIEENIQREVLLTARHPEVRFESTRIDAIGEDREIHGTLTLTGRERELKVRASRVGARWETTLTLDQRDFGITPYSAMLGTLKIKPEIRVRVRLPA